MVEERHDKQNCHLGNPGQRGREDGRFPQGLRHGGGQGEETDAADAFDQQMDALLQGGADLEREQVDLSLDEIVEREIQQYDPFRAQDPFGPYDPFGPATPSFGPFGPIGPGM